VAAKNAPAARAEAQIVLKRDPSNTQARAILDTGP
jgi:hypothetical protein